MVRCMTYGCGLPLMFWGDAAEYAVNIVNRTPSNANTDRQSPLQMLTKIMPALTDIVVFGLPCMVHRNAKNKSLGERGKAVLIIGQNGEIKGYRVYISSEKVVIVTQHVQKVE